MTPLVLIHSKSKRMLRRLIILTITAAAHFNCSPDKKLPEDLYMCGFYLGDGQEHWQESYQNRISEERALGNLRFYLPNNNRSWSTLGRIPVGGDSVFAWINLNDDTVLNGRLRSITLEFPDQIGDGL